MPKEQFIKLLEWRQLKMRIMNNIILVSVIIFFLLVTIGSPFIIYKNFSTIHYFTIQQIESTGEIYYNIDNFQVGDFINIRGWAFKEGEDIEKNNIHIVLKSRNSVKGSIIKTEMVVRKDVSDFYKAGNKYDNSGFVSRVKAKKLRDGNYDIYILYRNDDLNILEKTKYSVTIKDGEAFEN